MRTMAAFWRVVCTLDQRRNCSHARRDNVLSYRVTGSPLSSVRPTSRRSFGLAAPPLPQPRRGHPHRRSQPRRRMHRSRAAAQPRNAGAYGDRGADPMGPGDRSMPHSVERRAIDGAHGTVVRAQRLGPGVCAFRIARSPRLRGLTRGAIAPSLRARSAPLFSGAGQPVRHRRGQLLAPPRHFAQETRARITASVHQTQRLLLHVLVTE